ncbi:alpha/beta hydrolase [Soonwooa sp.]|uniref:alpha/beta fold hydrolase n=1 Tax=Soonwooa sp. TaxID=1938592 RepID=UPI0026301F39|nr:alpha/beta hydrolase [Soonwooa sp.]
MKKTILTFILIIFTNCVYAQDLESNLPKINISESVIIGNSKQYINIKGNDEKNPILLILHGGPGKSLLPFAPDFTNKLMNDFLVVNWDQRNTGETLKLNKTENSIVLLQSDALEVLQYLEKKYNKKKIFLLSHSWGSVMGFELASKHPELIAAYIAVSPVIDANESTKLFMRDLKSWANKTNNEQAIRELNEVKLPIQTKNDFFYAQKWLFIHNGVQGVNTEDFRNSYYNWMDEWFPIWKENAKTNVPSSYPTINCPIYFFIGSSDNQSYHTLANKYYKELKSKNKKLFWFRKSGHTIFNTEPLKFQKLLLKIKNKYVL